MATNMLGKVVAGAALGGASLLVFTPGIAFADNGGGNDGHHHEGKVYADPYAVKPGHDVKFIEVCAERQEHAFVWSEVTGKVKLHARDHHKRDWRGAEAEAGEESENGNGQDSDKGRDWRNGQGSDDDNHWKNGHGSRDGEEAGDDEETDRDWKRHGDEADQPGMNGESGGWGGGDEAADQAKKAEAEAAQKKTEAEAAQKKTDEEAARKKAEAEAATEEEKARDQDAAEEAADNGEERHKGPKFVYYGKAEVPWDTEPGTYKLKGSCGEGTLVVLPKGHVDGGDGGVAGGDRGTALGGAAMLGAAALGGIVLMRRRQADELV